VADAGAVCAWAPNANPAKAAARIVILNVLFMI